MGKRRSMMRKKMHDDASYNREPMKPWSDLTHDVLILVMMKLGFVDFLAFNRVCKSWRSLAISNRNKFIVSRPPMSISMTIDANEKEYYYLKDFEGRKFKTIVPHSAYRRCIGVTCGYLMLYGKQTKDFWFVNLVTRHELHFPHVPGKFLCNPGIVRAILVFSPSISRWVLVVYVRSFSFSNGIWCSIAGEGEWNFVSSLFSPIYDLIAFKGKIYTLNLGGLREMRLYAEPKLVLLKTEKFPKPTSSGGLRFVSTGENLYVIDGWGSEHPYEIHELDYGEMKWVSRENTGEKYAFFRDDLNYCKTITLQEVWADIHSQYGRYAINDKDGNGLLFHASMWYFFDDCLIVNLIHE